MNRGRDRLNTIHGPELQRIPTPEGHLEISIFEDGVPPRFRLTGAADGRVSVETHRENGKTQVFVMANRGSYWESLDSIPEPHGFSVTVRVGHDGHEHAYHVQFAEHSHAHGHEPHDHGHGPAAHTHGVMDPTIATTSRGIWAIKWSFVGLLITAVLQIVIVVLSGSVALLADTIHNFSDAFTAVPLAVAFLVARRLPTKRFTYGLGRVEDLAGMVIVVIIAISAAVAAYQSVDRLLHPRAIEHVLVVAVAGLIGFIGNEAVAVFRMRVGREIHSAALIADGYHARVDGFTSLAVLAGAIGVWLGFPIADPIAGLLISALIVKVVWDSAASVFTRALDGVDPKIGAEVAHIAEHVPGVLGVTDVRARWLGHHLDAEVHLTLAPSTSVQEAHAIGLDVQHKLMHAMPFITNAVVHADPPAHAGIGEHHHGPHEHDGLPLHVH